MSLFARTSRIEAAICQHTWVFRPYFHYGNMASTSRESRSCWKPRAWGFLATIAGGQGADARSAFFSNELSGYGFGKNIPRLLRKQSDTRNWQETIRLPLRGFRASLLKI